MARHYRHLTYEQRCQIEILKAIGNSPALIAKTLGVHRSTITRELSRNLDFATFLTAGFRGEHHPGWI